MAMTPDLRLRKMLADPVDGTHAEADAFFSNAEIEGLLEEHAGNIYAAAAEGWGMRAAYYHEAVDMMENGSDRKLSQLHKHADARAKYYEGKSMEWEGDASSWPGVVGQSFTTGVDEDEPIENWFPYPVTRMPGVL